MCYTMSKESGVVPQSPSWRSVLHPSRHRGRSLQYRRERTSFDRDSPRMILSDHSKWSFMSPPTLLRQAGDDSLAFPPNPLSAGALRDGISSQAPHPRTSMHDAAPLLTVVLLKLTAVLPKYCSHLCIPSYANASMACEVLDCVVAAGSPSHSPRGSVVLNVARPTSPLTLKYWMPDKKLQNSPTNAAMTLEGEWETFVSPFWLLAGAEVLSAGLEHLRLPTIPDAKKKSTLAKTIVTAVSAAASLTGLYQRINQDLLRTQEVLCEPFLRQAAGALGSHTMPKKKHVTEAAALASSIGVLVVAINVRCQLIDLQAVLFGVGSATAMDEDHDAETTAPPTLTEAATAVTLFLETMTIAASSARSAIKAEEETGGIDEKEKDPIKLLVDPILFSLLQELKAWKYCLETCAALEKCL